MNGRWLTFLCAVVLAACRPQPDRAANDSGAAPESLRADTFSARPASSAWHAVAGRHLLVALESPDSALVILPELTSDSSLASSQVALQGTTPLNYALFAPDGAAAAARLTSAVAPPRNSCQSWPVTRLLPVSPDTALRAWTIGLQTGRALGIPYAPLERQTSRDSARLVIDLTRLASQAPNDTAAAFRGLPYVVRSAYSAVLADSHAFIFGELVRRVNVEANPHEERTTIIGGRDATSASDMYMLAYSERHMGDEESVPTTELIGLVRLRDGTDIAFGARDYSDGGTFVMFERGRGARWRLRWQSAYAGC